MTVYIRQISIIMMESIVDMSTACASTSKRVDNCVTEAKRKGMPKCCGIETSGRKKEDLAKVHCQLAITQKRVLELSKGSCKPPTKRVASPG